MAISRECFSWGAGADATDGIALMVLLDVADPERKNAEEKKKKKRKGKKKRNKKRNKKSKVRR